MKLWQSLGRTDQPKTKKQAEDEDMGLFGEIKQKKVTREKRINLNKQKWVWSGNPRRHLCYCYSSEKKGH